MTVSNSQLTCSMLGMTRTWANYLCRVPWTARRSNQSILKEVSPEYSQGGLMLKLKLPILGPPDVKNWLMGKDPDARKDWRQKEKGTTEDEMVGWHHYFAHEFEQSPGGKEGQGNLLCCSPWSLRVSMTQQRNNDKTLLLIVVVKNVFTNSKRN